MSALQPLAGSRLSPRATREVARVSEATEVAVAQTAGLAAVETAKLEALQQVAGRALQGVALVSQLEQQLGQIVPIAVSRLQGIADMHALASAEVVARTPGRLR